MRLVNSTVRQRDESPGEASLRRRTRLGARSVSANGSPV
jgi:hypothetical protein